MDATSPNSCGRRRAVAALVLASLLEAVSTGPVFAQSDAARAGSAQAPHADEAPVRGTARRPVPVAALHEEIQAIGFFCSDEQSSRLREIVLDGSLPTVVRQHAMEYATMSAWVSPGDKQRTEADAMCETLGLDAKQPDALRLASLAYLLCRWADDASVAAGVRVIEYLKAQSSASDKPSRFHKQLCDRVVAARPQHLDRLSEADWPLLASTAQRRATELRALDPSMTYVEILCAEDFRSRRIRSWEAQLRAASSRKPRAVMPIEPDALATADPAEIRRAIADLRRLSTLDLVALEVHRRNEAQREIAAGEKRAQQRVQDAAEAAARYSPGISLPIFWTETSVFMTESGRLESSSEEYGFTLRLGGNTPRELRDDEIYHLSLADEPHARAARALKDAERNLESLREDTLTRAQARLDEIIAAQANARPTAGSRRNGDVRPEPRRR